MKILILCTGNSCRSQMAEGILKSLDSKLEVYSAGTKPSEKVNPTAIQVMQEIGMDIKNYIPKSADLFIGIDFDYVITVCDHAKENCPLFQGNVKHKLHIGFDDPAEAQGTDNEVIAIFRRIRDEIKLSFSKFYTENILNNKENEKKKD